LKADNARVRAIAIPAIVRLLPDVGKVCHLLAVNPHADIGASHRDRLREKLVVVGDDLSRFDAVVDTAGPVVDRPGPVVADPLVTDLGLVPLPDLIGKSP